MRRRRSGGLIARPGPGLHSDVKSGSGKRGRGRSRSVRGQHITVRDQTVAPSLAGSPVPAEPDRIRREGQQPRLIYRVRSGRRRADKREGFTETDYARLPDAAHQQLGGRLVLVWDNLNTHVSRAMRGLITARGWLTVYQ